MSWPTGTGAERWALGCTRDSQPAWRSLCCTSPRRGALAHAWPFPPRRWFLPPTCLLHTATSASAVSQVQVHARPRWRLPQPIRPRLAPQLSGHLQAHRRAGIALCAAVRAGWGDACGLGDVRGMGAGRRGWRSNAHWPYQPKPHAAGATRRARRWRCSPWSRAPRRRRAMAFRSISSVPVCNRSNGRFAYI